MIKPLTRKRLIVTCEHIIRIKGKIEPGHHCTKVYYADLEHGELAIDVHHCTLCCYILPYLIETALGIPTNPEIVRCELVVEEERALRRRHCMTCNFCADLALQAGHDIELINEAGIINDEHRRAMQT